MKKTHIASASAQPQDVQDCKICEGAGYLKLGGNRDYKRPCVCTLRFLYRKSLGAEIYNARKLTSTPFTDLIDKNVFIRANRRDFLPHLRHALIEQGTQFFHRVTNDSMLLDAWLSKDKQSSKEDGSTTVTYTSLRDLVDDPQLVVLFLGVVSYPNRALPGVLLEALRIRYFEGKPTWVVASHSNFFIKGHLCWSQEGDDFLVENFLTRKIKPSAPTKSLYEGIMPAHADPVPEDATEEEETAHKKARLRNLSSRLGNL
jgi:hypothetical protein